ncbi:hypothetical protein H9Q74_012397 [Fusarium xylarioides]|nr:hypothetical protein H9Q71_010815 [Fusarium xylarioides]KAG5814101.1 hypothetical protein H9Q74_012397 [Fusarium xylarioides]
MSDEITTPVTAKPTNSTCGDADQTVATGAGGADGEPQKEEPENGKHIQDLHLFLHGIEDNSMGSKQLEAKLKEFSNLNGPDALKNLLNASSDRYNTSPLHFVSYKGLPNIARQLLDAGADASAQDVGGCQPLHIACTLGNDELVQCLLGDSDYVPKCDKYGRSPLTRAAMRIGNLELETMRLLVKSTHSFIDNVDDFMGWTPMHIAVMFEKESLITVLLENNAKLDIQGPGKETPLIMAATSRSFDILKLMIRHVQGKGIGDVIDKIDDQGMTVLMHVCTALCGDDGQAERAMECLEMLMELQPNLKIADGYGNTMLHYILRSATADTSSKEAVIHAAETIMDSIPMLMFVQNNENETPFAVLFDVDGVRNGLHHLLRKMVDYQKKENEERLLSWLALRVERHKFGFEIALEIQDDLWTANSYELRANDFGEWVIYHEMPGCLLDYIKAMSKNEHEGKHGKFDKTRSSLKKCIQVLRKAKQEDLGRKLPGSKDDKKEDEDQWAHKHPGIGVLQDMEDIVDLFLVEKAPIIQESRKISKPEKEMNKSLVSFHAAISQIGKGTEKVSRFTKFRNIQQVIYGPETFANVREIIERSKKRYWETDDIETTAPEDETESTEEFTWIHLPSTNDLVRKIARTSNLEDKPFQDLASFFRTSWVEIPDRVSESRFMRPRFVENIPKTSNQSSEIENIGASALYMPYLSFSTYHAQDKKVSGSNKDMSRSPDSIKNQDPRATAANDRRDNRKQLIDAYKGRPIHASSTLDEYYYQFANDADSERDRDDRNEDQVVTKYLPKIENKDRAIWPLLRVNQLWAWTIGPDWLITASSCASSDERNKFVTDILTHLSERSKDGNHWGEPVSPAELRQVIVEYCISVYERKYDLQKLLPPGLDSTSHTELEAADQGEVVNAMQDSKTNEMKKSQRSIRQIFSDSINEIGRGESGLFRAFCNNQEHKERESEEKDKQLGRLKRATRTAAHLLYLIKDIRDELNILRTVAGSQQKVQSATIRHGPEPTCHTHQGMDNDLTSKYIFDDIIELDKAATQTQNAVS